MSAWRRLVPPASAGAPIAPHAASVATCMRAPRGAEDAGTGRSARGHSHGWRGHQPRGIGDQVACTPGRPTRSVMIRWLWLLCSSPPYCRPAGTGGRPGGRSGGTLWRSSPRVATCARRPFTALPEDRRRGGTGRWSQAGIGTMCLACRAEGPWFSPAGTAHPHIRVGPGANPGDGVWRAAARHPSSRRCCADTRGRTRRGRGPRGLSGGSVP